MCQEEPQSLVAHTLDELNAANIVRRTKKEIHHLRNITHTIVNNILSPMTSTDKAEQKKESSEEIADRTRQRRQNLGDNVDLKLVNDLEKVINLKIQHDEEADKIYKIAADLNNVTREGNQESEFRNFMDVSGLGNDIAKIIVDEKIAKEMESHENKRSKRQINVATLKLQEEHNDLAEIEKRFRKIIAKHKKADLNPIKIPNGQLDKINKEFQEDMLLKDITLLEKTEEALAEVMKIHQERHEAVEELLHDELEQMKEEKLASLMEIKKEPKHGENAFIHINNLRSSFLKDEEKMPPSKRETGDTKDIKFKNYQVISDRRSYLEKRKESFNHPQISLIKPLETKDNLLTTENPTKEPLKFETITEHAPKTTISIMPHNKKRLEGVSTPLSKYIEEFYAKKNKEEAPTEKEDYQQTTAAPSIKKKHTFRSPRTDWRKPETELSKESKQIIKRKSDPSDIEYNEGIANAAEIDPRELYREKHHAIDERKEVKKDPANFGITNAAKLDSRELYREKHHAIDERKEAKKDAANFGIANAAKLDSRELYREKHHAIDERKEAKKDPANFGIANAAKLDSRELYREKHHAIDDEPERKKFFRQAEWKGYSPEGKFDTHNIEPTIYVSPEETGEPSYKKSRAAEYDDRSTFGEQARKEGTNGPMVNDRIFSEQQIVNKPNIEVISRKTNREGTTERTTITGPIVKKENGHPFLVEGKLDSKFESSKHPENFSKEREMVPEPVPNQFFGDQSSNGKPSSEKPEVYSTIDKHKERSKGSHYTEGSTDKRLSEENTDGTVQKGSVLQQSVNEKSDRITTPEASIVKQSVQVKQHTQGKSEENDHTSKPIVKQSIEEKSERIDHIIRSTAKHSDEEFPQGKTITDGPIAKQPSQKQSEENNGTTRSTFKQPNEEIAEGKPITNGPVVNQSTQEKSEGNDHTTRSTFKHQNEEISKGKTTTDGPIVIHPTQEKSEGNYHTIRSIIKHPNEEIFEATITPGGPNAKQHTPEKSEGSENTNRSIFKQSNEEMPINKQSNTKVSEIPREPNGQEPAVKIPENGEPDIPQKYTTEGSVIKHSSTESNKPTNRQKIVKFREGHKSKPNTDGVAKKKPETTMGSQTTEGPKHENETASSVQKTGAPEEGRSKRDTENSEKTTGFTKTADDGNSTSSEERTSNSILKLPADNTSNRSENQENVATFSLFDDLFPKTLKNTKEAIDNLHLPEYLHNFGKLMENIPNVDNLLKNVAVPAHGISEHVQKIDRNKRESENVADIIPKENLSAAEPIVTSPSTENINSTTDSSAAEFLKLGIKLDAILENETSLSKVLINIAEKIVNNKTAQDAGLDEKESDDQGIFREHVEAVHIPDTFTEKNEKQTNWNGPDFLEVNTVTSETVILKTSTEKNEKQAFYDRVQETEPEKLGREKYEKDTVKNDANGIKSLDIHQKLERERQETSTEQQPQVKQQSQGLEPFETYEELESEKYKTSTAQQEIEKHATLTDLNAVDLHETLRVGHYTSTDKEEALTEQPLLEIPENEKIAIGLSETYERLETEQRKTSTEQQPIEKQETQTIGIEHETSTEQRTDANTVDLHETTTLKDYGLTDIQQIEKTQKDKDQLEEPTTKEHIIKKSKKHYHRHDIREEDPISPRLEAEQSIVEQILRKLNLFPTSETKPKHISPETKTNFKRSTNENVQKAYPIIPQQGEETEIFRQLKPGVYVIPSKEMTNVHAEQVTRGAAIIKHGKKIPNVLSLNIYYDKKPGSEEIENNAGEDGNRFYNQQKWAKPPIMPPYNTALNPQVMQPIISQNYKPLQPSQQRIEPQYKNMLPFQPVQPLMQPPIVASPGRNIYNNRYPLQQQYTNFQPPAMDPYLMNQQSPNYYYQQPKEENLPEILPVSSFSTRSKPQPQNQGEIPDKETEFNLEIQGDKENDKNYKELNKEDISPELKRKSIERYWNRTLAEIFQETKKDPFWEFLKKPTESRETVDNESIEKVNKPESDEEKNRNKRSLNFNDYFDTKPFDNAWREPQETTLKYLLKNNIVNKNSELVKNLVENSITKLRIPQYNPLDNRIHKKNSNNVFEFGGPKELRKEVPNFELVSPELMATPSPPRISTPDFTVTTSNRKSNVNYDADPFQRFYDMIVKLITSALEPLNN